MLTGALNQRPNKIQNKTSTKNVAEHADLNLLKLLVQKLRRSQQKHIISTSFDVGLTLRVYWAVFSRGFPFNVFHCKSTGIMSLRYGLKVSCDRPVLFFEVTFIGELRLNLRPN